MRSLLPIFALACTNKGKDTPATSDSRTQVPTETAQTAETGETAQTGETGSTTPPPSDWPHPNLDLTSSRAQTSSPICGETAEQMTVAWRDDVITPFGISTNPIVRDGVVYYQTMASDISALDLATGTALWRYQTGATSIGPTGVAVDDSRVYAATDPLTFSALDRYTGDLLWSVDLRLFPTEGIDIQPLVWDGVVYVATVPMIPGAAHIPSAGGVLFALDADDGGVLWSFDTIDDRASFWGDPEVNSGGGAWFPPTLDPERGRLYWGIANPGPFPGDEAHPNASSRPGPNLYTNSLVALDLQSGALLWHDQVTARDLFDFDFHLSPVLAEVGGDVLLIGAGKQGRVIAWDPLSGERRWESLVGRHENDTLLEVPLGETITVFPGIYGAAETPLAYADGLLYVPVADLGTRYTATSKEFPTFDEIWASTGELVALDAATGERVWSVLTPSPLFSGATIACDLVFTATFSGTLLGYDRATGEERYRWESTVGSNSWMAVAGETLLVPLGVDLGAEAPGLYALRLP